VGVPEEQATKDLRPRLTAVSDSDTPASLGYRMPAEWERHDATWISWPKDPDTFPPSILPKVEAAYAKMVECLGAGEEVRILVDDAKWEKRVRSILKKGSNVTYHRIKTADVWTRDYLPTYVRGDDVALVKWKFNAWGNKYDDLLPDEEAGQKVAKSTGLRVFTPGVVLEGGSIDTDGEGTVLTTEQCLLNDNRNPALGRRGVEKTLGEYIGASRVIWLGKGIEGDDTDGHVDDLTRFVGPGRVATAVEEKVSDPNHLTLMENLSSLEDAVDSGGRKLEAVTVPMPSPVTPKGGRLPASHMNFYIGNRTVLVPTYGGESDRVALRTFGDLFPSREVVGVDCRALVYGLGAIHCVTQQVPSAVHL
jgi:agmatine deiminase